jgi:mTERF domain-containing protein
MFRLRSCIASHILSSPSTSAISTLRRLISAAAPAISPHPEVAVAVAAEDYLVDTCGLTRVQAMTASTKLSHRLKSRAKADAVLAFLADLGLSSTAVTAIVARDPKFLCAQVDKTLAPNVAELTGLGLSPCEIARLVSLAPNHFRRRTIVSYLQYYLSLFGASGKLLRTLERSPYLVGANLERVVKPNIEFLRQCGLSACDIAKVCIPVPRLLTTKQERIRPSGQW